MYTKYFSPSSLEFSQYLPKTTMELAVVSSISEPPWHFVGNLIDCEPKKKTDFGLEITEIPICPTHVLSDLGVLNGSWYQRFSIGVPKHCMHLTLKHRRAGKQVLKIHRITNNFRTNSQFFHVGLETTQEPLAPSNICKHPRHQLHHGIHPRSSSLEEGLTHHGILLYYSPNLKTCIWNGQFVVLGIN